MDESFRQKGASWRWDVMWPYKEGRSDTCYAWMDVEDVMLSEMSQSQKDNTCVILRR